MNLIKFLKLVDKEIEKMTVEEKENFLHEYARTLPENQREKFLKALREVQQPEESKRNMQDWTDKKKAEIEKEIAVLKKQLKLINSAELMLDSEYNWEYDEWHNSDVEEFIYSDPNGILKIIENACMMVHKCVDWEFYKEASGLADLLLELEIEAEGAYGECMWEPMQLADLAEKELLDYPIKKLILDAMYAVYHITKEKKRPEEIYRLITNNTAIRLQDFLQMGSRELEDWKTFLEQWIAFLGIKCEREVERYLIEAIDMVNDFEKEWEYARMYKEYHPVLYKKLFEKKEYRNREQELFEVGKEALSHIQVKYVVRSRIALFMAEMYGKHGREEMQEKCWFEAYRSDTDAVNYLRLVCESKNALQYKQETSKIYKQMFQSQDKFVYAVELNQIDVTAYYILAFLHGDFTKVLDEGMNCREALGWSSNFMKQGIALFLLYLYQGENLQSGGNEMCRRLISDMRFSIEKYNTGLTVAVKADDMAYFCVLLKKWKTQVSISQEECQKIISRLEKWIELRVVGIMENNRRNYYGECAAFIAALGEVKESFGEFGTKERIMEKYKSAYPRRSAFHQELRKYGMLV